MSLTSTTWSTFAVEVVGLLKVLLQCREGILGPVLQIVVLAGGGIGLEQRNRLLMGFDLHLHVGLVELVAGKALELVQLGLMLVVELGGKLSLDVFVLDQLLQRRRWFSEWSSTISCPKDFTSPFCAFSAASWPD